MKGLYKRDETLLMKYLGASPTLRIIDLPKGNATEDPKYSTIL